MSDKTGGPAFPLVYDDTKQRYIFAGMTLRDYFAASMISAGTVFRAHPRADTIELVAKQAYDLADELLKVRKQ